VLAGLSAIAAVERPAADPERPPVVAQDSVGKAIFTGKGLCAACHGPDAKGTALAPDLTDGTWLHADGTVESIAQVVKAGVAAPKEHPAPMPPMGGASLSPDQVKAAAAYVHSLGGGK
jgi:cbb3-type cytochrome c oxidase subunit III